MENATNTETASVADTIINQINHSDLWARARWGVKEALALGVDTAAGIGGGVQFNCTKRIKIIIRLDATTDTYSIELGRLKGKFEYKKVSEMDQVYGDSLVRTIDFLFSKAFGSV